MTKNNTKRALTTSALAMILCVAMLIGTTFAWFTDTASTAVNKIQAGNLDVALEMATAWDNNGTVTKWESAEGQTLQFKKAAGAAANEKVLWEPGCTYELPEIRIVNKGNLALKYKIVLSGIMGDAKLNEAITWSIGGLDLSAEGHLKAEETSAVLTIKGHMKEEAGNEYQELSIDGIGITVVATQDTVEYDSKGYKYDVLAQYPVYAVEDAEIDAETKQTKGVTSITSNEVVSENDKTSLATATVSEGAKTTSKDDATSIPLTLSIENVETSDANFTVNIGETQAAKTLEIKIDGLADDNEKPIIVTMYVGTGLKEFKLFHNSNEMTLKKSAEEVTGEACDEYFYNQSTGFVTMATKTFSPFTYIYDATVVETSDQLEESLQEGGTTILSKNITFDGTLHADGDSLDTIIKDTEYVQLVLNSKLEANNITETAWGLIRVSKGSIRPTLVISGNEEGQIINSTNTVATVFVTGGDVIINSGYFENTGSGEIFNMSTAEDGQHSLVINGGEFKANTVVYADWGANTTITINGGVFRSANAVTLDTYNGKFAVSSSTVAAINGGTFYGWDPSNYVDDNHTVAATSNDGVTIYTVTDK